MNCKKCNESFTIRQMVDGKIRNFQRRKYCLSCSPFGSGNTKKLELPKLVRKSRRNTQWRENQKRSRKERKEKLVQLFGGCCISCNYSKYIGALTFHHRNPKEKNFSLSHEGLLKKWETVLLEAKKCDLLCMNCHMEHHWMPS